MNTTTQTTEEILFLQSLTDEQKKALEDIVKLEQNARVAKQKLDQPVNDAKHLFNKSLSKGQVNLRNEAHKSRNIAKLAKQNVEVSLNTSTEE